MIAKFNRDDPGHDEVPGAQKSLQFYHSDVSECDCPTSAAVIDDGMRSSRSRAADEGDTAVVQAAGLVGQPVDAPTGNDAAEICADLPGAGGIPFEVVGPEVGDGEQAMFGRLDAIVHQAAPSSELTPEEIRFREEREGIVTHAVKASIAAARALHEIENHNGGRLWRKGHRTFRDYCAEKWGYKKSYTYLLLETGVFIAELEAGHSTNVDNLPANEGQVRPLLNLLKSGHENLRVECWNRIVADKAPAELTERIVKEKTIEFLKAKGLDIKSAQQPSRANQPAPDIRAVAMGVLARLRTVLADFPEPQRFDQMLQGITDLIGQDPEGAIVDVQAVTVESGHHESAMPESDNRHHRHESRTPLESRQAGTGRGLSHRAACGDGIDPNQEVPLTGSSVSGPQGGDQELQDRVAKAMNEDAAPVERSVAATATEPAQRASVKRGKEDARDHMSSRLFHSVLHPEEDYGAWLDVTVASHPADFKTPIDGGDARISLIRAKGVAYNDKGKHGLGAFNLKRKMRNSPRRGK